MTDGLTLQRYNRTGRGKRAATARQTARPILVMQGVTQDSYAHGLEWFSVWHRPHTVFDIDASVDPALEPNPDLTRARALLEEVNRLIDPTRM